MQARQSFMLVAFAASAPIPHLSSGRGGPQIYTSSIPENKTAITPSNDDRRSVERRPRKSVGRRLVGEDRTPTC
ncbi:hypothetical protein B0J12DRAFT_622968, partial [Macrophomina phaseolina]